MPRRDVHHIVQAPRADFQCVHFVARDHRAGVEGAPRAEFIYYMYIYVYVHLYLCMILSILLRKDCVIHCVQVRNAYKRFLHFRPCTYVLSGCIFCVRKKTNKIFRRAQFAIITDIIISVIVMTKYSITITNVWKPNKYVPLIGKSAVRNVGTAQKSMTSPV